MRRGKTFSLDGDTWRVRPGLYIVELRRHTSILLFTTVSLSGCEGRQPVLWSGWRQGSGTEEVLELKREEKSSWVNLINASASLAELFSKVFANIYLHPFNRSVGLIATASSVFELLSVFILLERKFFFKCRCSCLFVVLYNTSTNTPSTTHRSNNSTEFFVQISVQVIDGYEVWSRSHRHLLALKKNHLRGWWASWCHLLDPKVVRKFCRYKLLPTIRLLFRLKILRKFC